MEVVSLYLPITLGDIVKQYCSKYDRCYWQNKSCSLFAPSCEQLAILISKQSNPYLCAARAAFLGCLDLLQQMKPSVLKMQNMNWMTCIRHSKIWQWIYDECMQDPQLTAHMREMFHRNFIENVEIYNWFTKHHLIRNKQKLLNTAIEFGRMDLIQLLFEKGKTPLATYPFGVAAKKGHINVLHWAYDNQIVLDWSAILSRLVCEFPNHDSFQDLLRKTNVSTLAVDHLHWKAHGSRTNKIRILQFLMTKCNYNITCEDVGAITNARLTIPISLPHDTFTKKYSYKQLKWLEHIVDAEELRSIIRETEQCYIHRQKCIDWYISRDLPLTKHNRLAILRVANESTFNVYVNPDMVSTEWNFTEPQLLYMIRYIETKQLTYEITDLKPWYGYMNVLEVAQFIANHCHKKLALRDLQLVSLHRSVDILLVLRKCLPLEELFVHFVKDVDTLNQYIHIFPETDMSHYLIVSKAHEPDHAYLLFYLMSVHPDLCRDSPFVKKAKWGFDLKRKRD